MKKLLTILLITISVAAFGQYNLKKTIIDTTRPDGQRFIITFPVIGSAIIFMDSLKGLSTSTPFDVNGGTGTNVTSMASLSTPYISMNNSTIEVKVKIDRIVLGDTITGYQSVVLTLAQLRSKPSNVFAGIELQRSLVNPVKAYVLRRLSNK